MGIGSAWCKALAGATAGIEDATATYKARAGDSAVVLSGVTEGLGSAGGVLGLRSDSCQGGVDLFRIRGEKTDKLAGPVRNSAVRAVSSNAACNRSSETKNDAASAASMLDVS